MTEGEGQPEAVASVLDAVRAADVISPGRPLVVMLSGGRDSVCLLDVATQLAGPDSITTLHFNYSLRDGADDDEAYCRSLCEQLGVRIEVERPSAIPRSGNLQAWARELRYEAARHLAAPASALIATGHTASDQAETVLYRLAASPGRRALLGMAFRDGDLIRPLLGITREQTAAWCRARGLEWRDDPTNLDTTYARARVREEVLPALSQLHPAAEANVIATSALLREEAEVLEELVEEVLQGQEWIEVSRLLEFPPAVRRLVARRLAEAATGGYVPAASRRLGEVVELAQRTPHAALDVGQGARAVIEDGVLRFEPTPPLHEHDA